MHFVVNSLSFVCPSLWQLQCATDLKSTKSSGISCSGCLAKSCCSSLPSLENLAPPAHLLAWLFWDLHFRLQTCCQFRRMTPWLANECNSDTDVLEAEKNGKSSSGRREELESWLSSREIIIRYGELWFVCWRQYVEAEGMWRSRFCQNSLCP